MCKRFIAIPLLCLVIMAACPFSVFADSFPYPENTVNGSVNISFEASSALYPVSSIGSEVVSFGTLWTGRFNNISSTPDGYSVTLDTKFVLNLQVGGDLFIAYPYYIDGGMDFTYYIPALDAYRYPSLDYNVDFGSDWPVNIYTPNVDTSSFDKTFGKSSLYVKFICYRNVPAGIYTGVYQNNVNDDTMCFGVYASHSNQMNALVDNFLDSVISETLEPSADLLSAFLKDLRTYKDSLTSDSVMEAILYELEYQSSVGYLMQQVDAVFVNAFSSYHQMFNMTLLDLFAGQISYDYYLLSMLELSHNVSALCSTPEQLACIEAAFNSYILLGQFVEERKARANLESAISDGDVSAMEDYYAAESELIAAFDQAKFKAQLDFETWFTLLPPAQTIEYKKFFDYMLNESPIKEFIMIPVSMGLVCILLGTGLRFSSSRRGDDHD